MEWLQASLPIGASFLDWRGEDYDKIKERLSWPLEGICFDIEHSDFWLPEWGEKPLEIEDRFEVASIFVRAAPKLIPIYSHRYMPDAPSEIGNPVFSVHQTDIIVYGIDLETYLSNEFGKAGKSAKFAESRGEKRIEFWSRLVDLNNGIDGAV